MLTAEKVEWDTSSDVAARELGSVLIVNSLSRSHVIGRELHGLFQLLIVKSVLRVAVEEESVSLDGILLAPQLEEVVGAAFQHRQAIQVMLCSSVQMV